jgi:hypothetical protein
LRPEQDKYAPISNYQGLEAQPDPLIWEEGDEVVEEDEALLKKEKGTN